MLIMKKFFKKIFLMVHSYYSKWAINRKREKAIKFFTALEPSEYINHLKKMYKERVGIELNMENPKRFSEKIQWRKFNELTPIMSTLSDKYAVREWIKEKIGEEYLIPLLGVWDSFDEIDFEKLPDSFVLKTNNASGTNMIVENKARLNMKKAKKKFDKWMQIPFGLISGFEFQYLDIKPKIIAEKNMLTESNGIKDLPDYKFYCFDGKVYCSFTRFDYALNPDNSKMYFLDRDYNILPVCKKEKQLLTESIPKPKNYEKMVEIAEKLSEGFSHVRVDLYNIDGEIYFGEMTFTNMSGFVSYNPDEFDFELGRQWKLPIDEN